MTLATGARFGSYEIRGLLGTGGMGEVYRARDTKLEREVAIKVLPPELSSDARRLQRFEKEARTVSALNHPNVVTVYDVGALDGSSFIAMELVEGKTLRELLEDGAVPLRKLLAIGAQVADGLARAHASGIVHRDLKPENLMVTRDGFVKILDFGLAKLVRGDFEASRSAGNPTLTWETEAGVVLGTVGYMSPEQAIGRPVDFRSDQFSFGSILYEMISGKRAFQRPAAAQTLSAIIDSEPEPLLTAVRGLPMSLAWIVERCLAKDPEDRYGSTKDLARDLALLREHSSGGSGTGVLPPAGRRLRVSRAALGGAALAVAALAALTFLAGERRQARRDREAPPPNRTTLTFRRGFLTGARFAPDGQTIVYSASWDGRPSEVFMTRVGSTESRSLFENAGILAVSSRGEMAIAIDCDHLRHPCAGTLARVPLAGGAPREVIHGAVSADWSPDGNELAVASLAFLEYPVGTRLHEAVPTGFLSSVRISPDGDLVAFLEHPRRDSDRGILTVVDRAGQKTILTREWARLGPILWSPTGKEVFFSRWGSREIRGASLSGRTRRASWIPGLDDVSREGLFLDCGTGAEDYRSTILARVPSEPEERNLSWLGRSVAVALTADGTQLLFFEEGRDPERSEEEVFTTFLRHTDGPDAIRLGDGRALALSPDTQWALAARASPEPHLVLLPTGAGEARRLPGDLPVRRASFFPDGRRIVFVADADPKTTRSYIQDVDGGPPKAFGEEGFIAMVVSPDGRTVAGLLRSDFRPYLYSVDDRSPPRPVPGALPREPLVQWSSDGKAIYAWGAEPRRPLTLYRLDLATGRRERWKELGPPDTTGLLRYGPHLRGQGLTITPDGKYYAYTFFTDSSRLTLWDAGPNWWR